MMRVTGVTWSWAGILCVAGVACAPAAGGPDAGGPDAGGPDAGGAVVEDPEARAMADEAAELARPWVEAGWVRGVSIAAFKGDSEVYVGLGRTHVEGPAPEADTLFEIGSITKTFTGVLLAEAVRRGEVTLDTRAGSLLPEGRAMPSNGGDAITLEHLSTHRSSLPRLPTNFSPAVASQPYADYLADDLYDFLDSYRLPRRADAAWDYSNLGTGLLGELLARAAGTTYDTLLRERLLTPLQLEDTMLVVDEAHAQRFAVGSDCEGEDVDAWRFDVLAPAGAIRSSARDLVKWLRAHAEAGDSGLGASMKDATTFKAAAAGGLEMGLGWILGDGRFMHDGGVGGMESFAGFDTRTGVGVVVLVNTSCGGCAPFAAGRWALLDDRPVEVEGPPVEVALDATMEDRLLGRYDFDGGGRLDVTRDSRGLWARLSGQTRVRVHPTAPDTLVYRVVVAELQFELPEVGHALSVALLQNGATSVAAYVP